MTGFDTIAARATAPGTGALAVIRISGPGALALAEGMFSPRGGPPLGKRPCRTAVFGRITRGGAVLDSCVAIYFKAPASYTGEDVVELQCHGGAALTDSVLRMCFERGARPALPGEFTKRAFLNGKLALSEAEAVAELIGAQTEQQAQNAAAQLEGALASEYEELYRAALDVTAHLTAWIDYTEEGVDPPALDGVLETLGTLEERAAALAESFFKARPFSRGVACAICGKPNVGKSSLLNALAGYERAIVTSEEGTTRDTVEAQIELDGLPLVLTDTAGLRRAAGEAEELGVARSKAAARRAGLLLAVFDGSSPRDERDDEVLELARSVEAPVIYIANKADLGRVFAPEEEHVALSARTGEGLELLKEKILALFDTGGLVFDGGVVSSARQAEALTRAAARCASARAAILQGFTPDVVWVDAEEALRAFGEVSGRAVSEEVLAKVFENFCVGK